MQDSVNEAAQPTLPLWKRALTRLLPLAYQAAAFGGAFLASRAPMLNGQHPLGLAMCIGCPVPTVLAACAGASVGYALQGRVLLYAPYLAAVAVLGLARMVKQKSSSAVRAAGGSAVFLGVGWLMCRAAGSSAAAYWALVSESMLAGGIGYLLHCFFDRRPYHYAAAAARQRAGVVTFFMVCIVALTPYKLWYLHPVHIAAGLVCLAAACRERENGGAVFGIAAAAALLCCDARLLYAGIGIAMGALCVGLFIPQRRMLAALTYTAVGFGGALAAPGATDGLLLLTELLFTSALFMALPPAWFEPMPARQESSLVRARTAQLAGRLNALSQSLESVGTTVTDVCARLPKERESYADVYNAAADAACKRCKLNLLCWVDKYDETVACLQKLAPLLAQGTITVQDLPPILECRCVQPEKLTLALNSEYAAFASRRETHSRTQNMRTALTEQYNALAVSLAGLAQDISRQEMPDMRRSTRLASALHSEGYAPLEVMVMYSDAGRLRAQIRFSCASFSAKELDKVSAIAEKACDMRFSPPVCTRCGSSTALDYTPCCVYKLEYGVASLSAHGKICADAVRCFTSPDGVGHAVLCDGMGTGSEAAVDGNMAAAFTARLLEAGFGCREAARLVNVALSLKGDDDTSAGVDLLSVNLYTGKATILKAGGAPSYFVRSGKVSVQTAQGLPIGILGSVSGRSGSFTLLSGDTVIFVSDGAVEDGGEKWLGKQLVSLWAQPPQEIADRLAAAARARSQRPDDITVMVMRLEAV